jgi:hypothetical protein
VFRIPHLLFFVRQRRVRTIAGSLLVALTFSFSGCATKWFSHPRPPHPAPAAHRFETYLFKPSARRNCSITVVREAGVSGAGLTVYLDSDRVARLGAGDAMTVYVKAGMHLVTLRPLFSPSVHARIVARRDEPAALRIIDRNGNYELRVASRSWLASIEHTLHFSSR